jgi:hypothetical protein
MLFWILFCVEVELKGKHAVVVGTKSISGVPVTKLLLSKQCFVRVCQPGDRDVAQTVSSQLSFLSLFTQIHSWMNLLIATVGSVCLSVCVWRSWIMPRVLNWVGYLWVGRMLHPSSNQAHQIGLTKIPPASFPFPVPNMEGVGKNLKISCSMIDSSAAWKTRAVLFTLLDRACRAAHCANIDFSIPDYSPVLNRLKCLAQRWTLIDAAVLVVPSGESKLHSVVPPGEKNCKTLCGGDTLAINTETSID